MFVVTLESESPMPNSSTSASLIRKGIAPPNRPVRIPRTFFSKFLGQASWLAFLIALIGKPDGSLNHILGADEADMLGVMKCGCVL